MKMFKVGDKVRRTHGSSWGQFMGYEGVVEKILDGWLHFPDGTRGLISKFKLVSAAPTGPVVTETVTKTRIVPGVYDGVRVKINPTPGKVFVYIHETLLDADELDAAAAVLSELAKGLRDA